MLLWSSWLVMWFYCQPALSKCLLFFNGSDFTEKWQRCHLSRQMSVWMFWEHLRHQIIDPLIHEQLFVSLQVTPKSINDRRANDPPMGIDESNDADKVSQFRHLLLRSYCSLRSTFDVRILFEWCRKHISSKHILTAYSSFEIDLAYCIAPGHLHDTEQLFSLWNHTQLNKLHIVTSLKIKLSDS